MYKALWKVNMQHAELQFLIDSAQIDVSNHYFIRVHSLMYNLWHFMYFMLLFPQRADHLTFYFLYVIKPHFFQTLIKVRAVRGARTNLGQIQFPNFSLTKDIFSHLKITNTIALKAQLQHLAKIVYQCWILNLKVLPNTIFWRGIENMLIREHLLV